MRLVSVNTNKWCDDNFVFVNMKDLSLHILDIAENSVNAEAKNITIEVIESESKDELCVSIKDDGKGMDEKTAEESVNPFFTTKKGKRFGLGLALFAQAVKETGGTIKIESRPFYGTEINAVFKLNHPDVKPLGNIAETIAALVMGNPQIHFIYSYKKGDYNYCFDSHKSAER